MAEQTETCVHCGKPGKPEFEPPLIHRTAEDWKACGHYFEPAPVPPAPPTATQDCGVRPVRYYQGAAAPAPASTTPPETEAERNRRFYETERANHGLTIDALTAAEARVSELEGALRELVEFEGAKALEDGGWRTKERWRDAISALSVSRPAQNGEETRNG